MAKFYEILQTQLSVFGIEHFKWISWVCTYVRSASQEFKSLINKIKRFNKTTAFNFIFSFEITHVVKIMKYVLYQIFICIHKYYSIVCK